MRNLLAFDLGASNGRAILGQFDGETITMCELHRFENNYIEMNGVFYWDLPYLYNQLKQGLLAFKNANVGELDCIGIDTWGVDYGLLDKNGQLLSNPRSYRYAVDEDMAEVWKTVDFPTLFARTGIATMNFNTVYQLYRRKRQHDPALDAAQTLLMLPDLLGFFLTGEAKTEYTNATTSMLYNPTTKDWDWQTIDALGLPRKIFTKLDRAGALRGTLRPELAAELGINQAHFAAVGTHDTASAVAAIPGTGSFAFCSSGTWSLFGVETDEPILSDTVRDANFSNEGTIQGGFRPLKTSWACGSFRSAAATGRRPVKTSAGTTLWKRQKRLNPSAPSSIPTTANSSPAAGWSRKFRTSAARRTSRYPRPSGRSRGASMNPSRSNTAGHWSVWRRSRANASTR